MVSVVSVKRLRGLIQTTNGSVAGLSPSRTVEKVFHTRNQTVSPGTLDDNVGRDLTESAIKGNQDKTETYYA